MSFWNYRVCRNTYTHPDGEPEDSFGIHEVFYNKEGDDHIWGVSTEPVAPHGETNEEFQKSFERYMSALNKPVLDLTTLKYERKETNED